MLLKSLIPCAVTLAGSLTAPTTARHIAPADVDESIIDLHLFLNSPNHRSPVESEAQKIADPTSPHYRQYLSPSEILQLSSPSDQTLGAVHDWLRSHDLDYDIYGDIIHISTTSSTVNHLLKTSYSAHLDWTSQTLVHTSLPDHIQPHIDFITPSHRLPQAEEVSTSSWSSDVSVKSHSSSLPRRFEATSTSSCSSQDYTTPLCLHSLYNVTYIPSPNKTGFAVYATESSTYDPSDLHTFISKYLPADPTPSLTNYKEVVYPGISGGSFTARFETALDTQTALGIAYPIPGILYTYGGVFGPAPSSSIPSLPSSPPPKYTTYDPFVMFLVQLLTNDTSTLPSVVSISESQPGTSIDPAYAQRICTLIGQVSLRGITFVASSGDNGPNGDQPTGYHAKIMETEFPASCPYVLAVGGTTLSAGSNTPNEEVAATQSTMSGLKFTYTASGGGLSTLFSRPAYQQSAQINNYVSSIPPEYNNISGFNRSGRIVPDVSALSTNFPTVVNGFTFGIGGTSASAPVWAGVIALLNDHELSKGRKTLGWINPTLYHIAQKGSQSGLKDIVAGGNNKGACYLLAGCTLPQTFGYNTTVGFDAVTGLGSPNVGLLMEALDGLAKGSTYVK